jgi:acid phosphatase (class A)
MIARARALVATLLLAFALASPAFAAKSVADLYYVPAGAVDLTQLLAPPPDPDSAMQKYDSRKIAEVLTERTPSDVAQASADAHRNVFVFGPVMGANFDEAHLPLTAALFKRANNDTEIFIDLAKAHFQRPRPAGSPETHGSYPSGHAAFASSAAILLSQMVPEKRDAIFARAAIFAESRIIAGVHYPTDVEAGWISGTVMAQVLMSQPKFQTDFAAAKAEVRRALGLTP